MSGGKIYLERPVIQATGEETGTPIPATTGTAAVTLQPFGIAAQGTYTVGTVPYTGQLEFINKDEVDAKSDTSITGKFPLNAYDGNLLVATITANFLPSQDTIIAPAGWTLDGYQEDGNQTIFVFSKIANNEPLEWTWNFTKTGYAHLTVMAFAGPTNSPLDVVNTFASTTANLDLTFPNETVIYVVYNSTTFGDTVIPTLPTGFTQVSTGTDPTSAVGYKNFAAAGPTGNMTCTSAGSTHILAIAYEAHQEGTNYAPVAESSSFSTAKNATFSGVLLASDVNDDSFVFSVVAPPSNGTVNITDSSTGAYTYSPTVGFSGSDSFTFKVNDGTVDSNVATVSITVTAPTTQDISFEVNQGDTYSGTLSGSSSLGQPLTFSIVNQPTKGTVTITDPSTGAFTYTPNAGATGVDTFTYKASTATSSSNTSSAIITIVAAAAPVAEDQSFTLTVNTVLSASLAATDANNDPLTYSIVGIASNGTVNITDINTGAFTYTPDNGYVGTDSFTWKAHDGTNYSNVATVSIDVSTDVIKVIAADGSGDYTSVQAFLNAVPADLSAATGLAQRWVGQIKRGTYNGELTSSGRITDSQHYVKLMAFPGHEHLGVPGAGVVLVENQDFHALFNIEDDYFEVWDIEATATSNFNQFVETTSISATTLIKFYNCIAHDMTEYFSDASDARTQFFNCVGYNIHQYNQSSSKGEFYNCTGIRTWTWATSSDYGIRGALAVNCIMMNYGDHNTRGGYNSLVTGSSNNVGNDGFGALTTTLAESFINPSDTGTNLGLKETAPERGFGVGPASNTSIPDFDIAYQPRSGTTTDAGAYMFVSHLPVAVNGSFNVDMNATYSGTLGGSDADNDVLTFSIVDPAVHGIATITNVNTGAFTYTPDNGYVGTDSFTFKINDGTDDSNVAVEAVSVNQIVYDAVLDNVLQPLESEASATYAFKDVFAIIDAALAPVESTAAATYAFKDVFAAIDVSLQPVRAEIHTQFIPENQLPVDVKARYSLQAVFEPRHKITTVIPG